ncbi:MAG: ORF6N domain-containing protein [Flavobacteriales bacterium]|nr:ORF6N domain-containing protein [Flavobacteriales bacterium]
MEPPAPYKAAPPADVAITGRIHVLRRQKVMLDRDLAELYGVDTKQLKRQVRRNLGRFPEDFMFELTEEENDFLRSQFGTLKQGAHTKYLPMAFTEQGVAMLSSVLNSEQAILVNIQIIRVFTRMREVLLSHRENLQKLEQLEAHVGGHDEEIQTLFDHITAMVSPAEQSRKTIGFRPHEA